MDEDTPEQIAERVQELMRSILEENGLDHENLISVLFTATKDLVSMFPATAAREMGLGDVPLLCAQELDVVGSVPSCVRVMAHVFTERRRDELHHVYLHGARGLRDDLPE